MDDFCIDYRLWHKLAEDQYTWKKFVSNGGKPHMTIWLKKTC